MLLSTLVIWTGGLAITGLIAKFGIINNSYNYRSEFIENYEFPRQVINEFIAYCNREGIVLNEKNNVDVVITALKQYFQVILAHRHGLLKLKHKTNIGMPSKITDELWHIFLEHVQSYNDFSRRAFGKVLVHVPNEKKEQLNEINPIRPQNIHKNVLNLMDGCKFVKKNNINITPSVYSGIPLIFAIDLIFSVPNGYYYTPQIFEEIEQLAIQQQLAGKSSDSSGGSCGGDFTSGSHGGGEVSSSDSGSSCGSSGDGGGCGGGCGG